MTKPADTAKPLATQIFCEFSRQPFDDCYCRNISGRAVPNIAMYCMDRYQECPIYQKHVLQKITGSDSS